MPEPIRKLAADTQVPARPATLRGGPPQNAGHWRNGPPAVPAAIGGSPDLPSLLKALRRRWLVAVSLGIILAAGAAGGLWMVLAPKYTANAQVLVSLQTPVNVGLLRDQDGTGRDFTTYLKTQAGRIKSRFVLSAALKKDAVQALPLIQEQAEPMQFLDTEILVETAENSPYINVSMMGTDPGAITTILKAVMDAYFDEVIKVEQKRKSERLAELDKIRTQIEEKVRLKKETFRNLANQIGSMDKDVVSQKHVNLLNAYYDLNKQYGAVKYEAMRAEGRLKAHKSRRAELDLIPVPEAAVTEAIEAHPRAKELVLRSNALNAVMKSYRENATNPEAEPSYQVAKQQLAELRKEMDPLFAQLRGEVTKQLRVKITGDYDAELVKLSKEYEVAAGQRDAVATELEKLRDSAEKLGNSSTELEMLKADIRQEDKALEKIKEEQTGLQFELNAPPRVSLAQEAGIQKKDLKRLLAALVLGPFAVFAGTCLAIAWLEFRARRIQSTDEVILGLGMRVVGSLPVLGAPAQRRLLATNADEVQTIGENTLLESVDAIRTLLLKDATDAATRVVMVTSAVGGEGKTTLASQLAGSLARAGRKTLLIDCDLRSPAVHQLFEQPLQPGFSEVLLGEVHIAEATRSTPVDGLWMIPAGQWDRDVMDALARDGLEEIVDKLKSDYDFIILDSHPTLLATDALLVGQYADAVLLSLLRDVSQAPRVHAASQRLGALGIRILGAVVQGMRPDECLVGGGGYVHAGAGAR